jgi:hypothetical protein
MIPTAEDARSVRWDALSRVYGNFHSTLVGLITSWWVSLPGASRTAMESGPTFAPHAKGKGSQRCDALLLADGRAVGVLEVEYLHIKRAMTRLRRYLGVTKQSYWPRIEFGVFVAYAGRTVGRGRYRHMPPIDLTGLISEAREHALANILFIAVNKRCPDEAKRNADRSDRFRNSYYWGEVSEVFAQVFDGKNVGPLVRLWPEG